MLRQNCCNLQHGRVGHHLLLQDEHCSASGCTSQAGAAGADGFVVGLPVTLNGTLTKRNTDSQQVRGRLLGCMQQASSDQLCQVQVPCLFYLASEMAQPLLALQGRRCRNFAENLHALAKRQGLPVYLYSESLHG